MFCGEIAALIPVDVELGLDGTRERDGSGQEGAVKKGSQERLPRDDDDGGLRLGLGGFCLRHCAISSQWLNRSFASSLFSSSSSAVSSSYHVFCASLHRTLVSPCLV